MLEYLNIGYSPLASQSDLELTLSYRVKRTKTRFIQFYMWWIGSFSLIIGAFGPAHGYSQG